MAKADLRKAENWRETGDILRVAREESHLSLKEWADEVGADERQITRWEKAEERPQFETVNARPKLKPFLAIAVAKCAGLGVEVETVMRVRRSA